jgi:hypothetical protein
MSRNTGIDSGGQLFATQLVMCTKGRQPVRPALTDLHKFGAANQRPLFFGHRMRQVRLA